MIKVQVFIHQHTKKKKI